MRTNHQIQAFTLVQRSPQVNWTSIMSVCLGKPSELSDHSNLPALVWKMVRITHSTTFTTPQHKRKTLLLSVKDGRTETVTQTFTLRRQMRSPNEPTFSSLHSLESVNAGHISSYLPTAVAPSCRSWHMRQIAARKKWSLAPCLSSALSIDELPSCTATARRTAFSITTNAHHHRQNMICKNIHKAFAQQTDLFIDFCRFLKQFTLSRELSHFQQTLVGRTA